MIPERRKLPESALDINQPDRRAKRCTPPRADTTPRTEYLKNQADRDAWMRDKQEKKRRNAAYERAQLREALQRTEAAEAAAQKAVERHEAKQLAPIEGKRERQLLAEAEAEIRRRRLIESRQEDL